MADFEYTFSQVNANPMQFKHLRINQPAPFIESEEPESFDLCEEEPQDCCSDETFKLLVLADPVFTNPERNDYSSFLYKVFGNNTIGFSLEKWNVSAWDEIVADLTVGGYGTFFPAGSLQTGINFMKFTGFKIEWRNVLINFGEGIYRVKASGTFFGNEWNDCSRMFCLKEYSINSANQTVRFEWTNNGIISYANPTTGRFKTTNFLNIDWQDMIRLTGIFGFPEDQQEVIDLSYQKGNHLEIERIRDKTNYNYTFKSGYYPDWVHYLLKDISFKSNGLLVTDYNKLGKHNFIRKAILKDSDGYTPDYANVYQKKYKVEVKFRDKLDDLGYSKHCEINQSYCAGVTIKDSNGNVVTVKPSGSIYVLPTGGGGCTNIQISNSNDSYQATIKCEESPFELPNINLTQPNGDVESNPSMINLSCTLISALATQDLNDDLTPTQINKIQRQQPLRSAQITSYRTGDDGDLEMGIGASFSTLSDLNIFGTNQRFTDELGGQTYTNNFVLDHLTGLMWNRIPNAVDTWNNAIDGCLAYTGGTFTDWFLANINQHMTILSWEVGAISLNYAPFSLSSAEFYWTSTTLPSGTTNALRINNINAIPVAQIKTNTSKYLYCRKWIPADFGL